MGLAQRLGGHFIDSFYLCVSGSAQGPCFISAYYKSESGSVVSDRLQVHGLHSPWNSPGQNTEEGSLPFSRGSLPNPEIEPRSPALQADSLPAESQGKPIVPKKSALIITVALYSNFPYLPLLSAFNSFFLSFVFNSLVIASAVFEAQNEIVLKTKDKKHKV